MTDETIIAEVTMRVPGEADVVRGIKLTRDGHHGGRIFKQGETQCELVAADLSRALTAMAIARWGPLEQKKEQAR